MSYPGHYALTTVPQTVGVAKGLAYLHEEDICHGDIKPVSLEGIPRDRQSVGK